MSWSIRKLIVSCGIVFTIIVGLGVWAGQTLIHPQTHVRAANTLPNALPYNGTANGPYHVQGNMIVDASGKQYIFHGVGRDGLEYNCSGDQNLDMQHLAYIGSGTNTSTATYWDANTVRLPLSEGFWLNGAPGFPCTAAQYQALVKQVVDTLTSLRLNVILDLQWTDANRQSLQGGGPWQMPDADSVTFWQEVAPIYQGYSNVLFELYNEPHPSSYACWQNGCAIANDKDYSNDCACDKTLSYQSVGMQALVNAVRGVGANNLVLVGGMNWGYDLSQISTYTITGSNIVYDTHPYDYPDKSPSNWDNNFGNISATYPVISAENGEYDCGTGYMSQLLPYLDAHSIGWIGWAWSVGTDICGYPLLINDYNGTPSTSMGLYVYEHLRSYVPTLSAVNKTWYFAEGRVGAGFKEYLTLNNPDPSNSCNVNIQYLLEGGGVVTKAVTVPGATRVTEPVNADLNVAYNQATGVAVSAIVTVNTASTPNCNGIVAERPMYFSWHSVNSGSDVVGATHLGTNFYFGDVPSGGGFTSFITILNPPNSPTANVTATYYANGKVVGTQSTQVIQGARGTLAPGALSGLPTHMAAVVTSTQPVMVERPSYFSNVNMGNAHTVSGAASVVGTQSLANDWLFAEGYTGGSFQEYLVISNLDSVHQNANVSVKIENSSGTVQTTPLTVAPFSQVIWNVNSNTPGASVSADVSSSGAKIVVEREMFFQYNHTIGGHFQVVTMGGTDVIGQTSASTAYAFAEGYSNVGYNEWLTVQNPSDINEVVNVVMVNGYGRVYNPGPISVAAHSRSTVDISSLVLQHMVQSGDDHRGYEVSMTVQTLTSGTMLVAERPMYWNTGSGGTLGGSDVIGYTPGG